MNVTKGAVVKLKSGGLQMTVASTDGETAHCVWFDHEMKFERDNIAVAALRVIREGDDDNDD